ncbi:MAG: hypothetical protein AAGH53_03435 [Pseudomonadota bacterium]
MTSHHLHAALKAIAVLALPALLIGCGSKRELLPVAKSELMPAPETMLPPAPYGAAEKPTANELLEPSTQARPGRSVELRRRSEVREDDPFDLPPPE